MDTGPHLIRGSFLTACVHTPNGISIGSAFSARLTVTTDHATSVAIFRIFCSVSLGSSGRTCRTASRERSAPWPSLPPPARRRRVAGDGTPAPRRRLHRAGSSWRSRRPRRRSAAAAASCRGTGRRPAYRARRSPEEPWSSARRLQPTTHRSSTTVKEMDTVHPIYLILIICAPH